MRVSVPQLVEAPACDATMAYETLAYIDAYDAVLDIEQAFVAYKETVRSTGEWRVRIASLRTAGAVFEPAMIEGHARASHAQGKLSFTWGYRLEPRSGDPRCIQFRVHVRDGRPAEVELFVQLRTFDHAPCEARSVRFPWPAS